MTGVDRASLTVVVIGLNEERNLERCLRSVRCALDYARASVSTAMVLYVDSGSSDRSIEIGIRLSDSVVRLRSTPSAAAARVAGLRIADGDYVQFLDGDMELAEDWLDFALRKAFAPASDRIAGIMGIRDDVYVDPTTQEVLGVRRNFYRVESERVARRFGGALLARRNVLLECGGYNPRLSRGEEPELYARLLARGYQVLEYPVPFVTHYTPQRQPSTRLRETFRYKGTAHSFGRAFLGAVRDRSVVSLMNVYHWTAFMWVADLATAGLLASGRWPLAAGLQVVTAGAFTLLGKPREFLLARARMYGVVRALGESARRWQMPSIHGNDSEVAFEWLKPASRDA